MAKTYNDLYLDIRQRLRKAGVEAAQLEARELICHAAGKSQEEFFKDSRLYAPRPVEEQLEADVQRRLAGEPVAYIIGQWNFYGLPLTVTPAVLIPRPDTEIIAARAIELAKAAGEHGRVLDLCTGSRSSLQTICSRMPSTWTMEKSRMDSTSTTKRKLVPQRGWCRGILRTFSTVSSNPFS